jgi:hypothetical protein
VGTGISGSLEDMASTALSAQQFTIHEFAPPDEWSPIAVVAFSGKPGHLVLVVGGNGPHSKMQRLDTAHHEPVWPYGEHRLIGSPPHSEPRRRALSDGPGQIDVRGTQLDTEEGEPR